MFVLTDIKLQSRSSLEGRRSKSAEREHEKDKDKGREKERDKSTKSDRKRVSEVYMMPHRNYEKHF